MKSLLIILFLALTYNSAQASNIVPYIVMHDGYPVAIAISDSSQQHEFHKGKYARTRLIFEEFQSLTGKRIELSGETTNQRFALKLANLTGHMVSTLRSTYDIDNIPKPNLRIAFNKFQELSSWSKADFFRFQQWYENDSLGLNPDDDEIFSQIKKGIEAKKPLIFSIFDDATFKGIPKINLEDKVFAYQDLFLLAHNAVEQDEDFFNPSAAYTDQENRHVFVGGGTEIHNLNSVCSIPACKIDRRKIEEASKKLENFQHSQYSGLTPEEIKRLRNATLFTNLDAKNIPEILQAVAAMMAGGAGVVVLREVLGPIIVNNLLQIGAGAIASAFVPVIGWINLASYMFILKKTINIIRKQIREANSKETIQLFRKAKMNYRRQKVKMALAILNHLGLTGIKIRYYAAGSDHTQAKSKLKKTIEKHLVNGSNELYPDRQTSLSPYLKDAISTIGNKVGRSATNIPAKIKDQMVVNREMAAFEYNTTPGGVVDAMGLIRAAQSLTEDVDEDSLKKVLAPMFLVTDSSDREALNKLFQDIDRYIFKVANETDLSNYARGYGAK